MFTSPRRLPAAILPPSAPRASVGGAGAGGARGSLPRLRSSSRASPAARSRIGAWLWAALVAVDGTAATATLTVPRRSSGKAPYDQAGKRRVDPATSRVGVTLVHAA